MAILAAAALAGCSSGTRVASSGGNIVSVGPESRRMLPAGSEINVKTNETLNGAKNHVGDKFSVTVREPLVAANGQTVVPEGTMIYGHITGLRPAEKSGDDALIQLAFDRIVLDGRSRDFAAKVLEIKGPPGSESTGAAFVGMVTGGDLTGTAAHDGTVSEAAGTVIAMGKDREPELPQGTRMTIRPNQSIRLP
jgi:hypothetical protein